MVTRRAKVWLTRGTTIGALVVLGVLVGATWVQSNTIGRDWLTVEHSTDHGSAVVAELGEATVLLRDGDDLDRSGTWGLQARDGFVRVGEVVEVSEAGVWRTALDVFGSIRPPASADFVRASYSAQSPPVPLTDVIVDGPLGEHAAWVTEGSEDTWVVLVHGNGDDRAQALPLLPRLGEGGYPALVPTYRNDLGAPSSRGNHHGYGRDEWRDLEAAIEFALAAGASDFVLVGYGSGASIVGTFLLESPHAGRVVGVVLDGPILSLGMTVDEAWAPSQVPGFVVGWAKAVATFRFGVDWAALDHLRRATEWQPPVLILHGREDDEAPLRASSDFATSRVASTLLVTFPGAGHGESWNSDPTRYESAVMDFLTEHAAGQSDFKPGE